MKDSYVFYIGKAATLLGVSRDTVRRWANEGKIAQDRNQMNSWRMFNLEEINRIRAKMNMRHITIEDAIDILSKE